MHRWPSWPQLAPSRSRARCDGRAAADSSWSSFTPISNDASEADVAGRSIDRLGVARCRPVATAVIGRAKMRASLQDFPWDPDVRLAGIEAGALGTSARI